MAICTEYAQAGMFNIFMVVFFSTLGFAFLEPYLFIGYLVSIALFGLYQAIFMANAGGAWDNAKKIVETELKAKGTPLHEASVVGDTVGDPFKDTSSVALNPIIKFTTLFGLLAVPLAVSLRKKRASSVTLALAVVFLVDLDVLRAPLVLRHADSRRRREAAQLARCGSWHNSAGPRRRFCADALPRASPPQPRSAPAALGRQPDLPWAQGADQPSLTLDAAPRPGKCWPAGGLGPADGTGTGPGRID